MFYNKYQEATHGLIGMLIFLADLAVVIGIPVYSFMNYGIGTGIISFFIALFIVSPIVSGVISFIGAIIMTTWTTISERNLYK